MIAFLLSIGISTAQAMPLTPYDEHLARGARQQLNAVMDSACRFSSAERAMVCGTVLEEAVRDAEAFDKHVLPDAELRYLIGLAQRYLGDAGGARKWLEQSLALEPLHVAASYDLGELLLIAGDLDGAQSCFERVAANNPDKTTQWIGHWRLAEVAAMRGDADGFESHLKLAVREGFSLRRIEGLPNWKAFYRNPDLRDVIEKMVTLYGTPTTLETLKPAQTKTAP